MTTFQGQDTSLVALLLKEGLITLEQGDRVEELAYGSGMHVGEVLVREGYITEKEIARFLTIQFQKPFIRISHYDIDEDVLGLLPAAMYFEHKFLPIDQFDDILLVASAGILTDGVIEEIYTTTRCDVEVYISLFSEIETKFSDVFSDDVIDESLAKRQRRARESGRVTSEADLPPEVANFFDSVAAEAFNTQSTESPMLTPDIGEVSGVLPPDVLNFFDTCESAALQSDGAEKGGNGKVSKASTTELPPDVLNFFDTCETRGIEDSDAGDESGSVVASTGPMPDDVAQFFDSDSGKGKKATTGPMPDDVAQFFDTASGVQSSEGEASAGLPADVKDFFDTSEVEKGSSRAHDDSLPSDVANFFDTASGANAAKGGSRTGKLDTASMPADVISFFESAESESLDPDSPAEDPSGALPADVLNFFDTNTQAQSSEGKKKRKKSKSSTGAHKKVSGKKSGKKSTRKSKKSRRSGELGNTQQALKFFESTESESMMPTAGRKPKKGKKPLLDEGAELFIDAASTSELPSDVLDFFDAVDGENESL